MEILDTQLHYDHKILYIQHLAHKESLLTRKGQTCAFVRQLVFLVSEINILQQILHADMIRLLFLRF